MSDFPSHFDYKGIRFKVLKPFAAQQFVLFLIPESLPAWAVNFKDIASFVNYARTLKPGKYNFDAFTLKEILEREMKLPAELMALAERDGVIYKVNNAWVSESETKRLIYWKSDTESDTNATENALSETKQQESETLRLHEFDVPGLFWAINVVRAMCKSHLIFEDISQAVRWIENNSNQNDKLIKVLCEGGFIDSEDDVRPAVMGQLLKHLNNMGIVSHKLEREDLIESESGVDISGGGLTIGKSVKFGAVLYSAGLIATTPAELRHLVSSDFDNWTLKASIISKGRAPTLLELDMIQCCAMAWAWAAGKKLGFHEHEIFDDGDFEFNGVFIKKQLATNSFVGISELSNHGMTDREIFPLMHKWLVGASTEDKAA
ncbi:MAG: hypothetical protein ACTS9Y_00505 [Methylophilus sp.]|uniref:hypothetical protein n=1 Tax=Methylophilus sp. TaxID=29541 RepID=UPI003F9FBD26